MPTEFKFGFDLQYSDHIKTEFEVIVECELRYINKEEYEVEFTVIKKEDDSEIKFDSLEIRDRAVISHRAWDPPADKLSDAYHDYCERQPQYDKYADNF